MTQYLMPPVANQPANTSNVWTMYDTASAYTAVVTAGYLSAQQALGHVFQAQDFIMVSFTDGAGLFSMSFSGNVITLAPAVPAAQTITDNQQFIGVNGIIMQSAGTWTKTRIGAGNYSTVHTAAANTPIISWDITPAIRTASGKGFKLASIDFIHQITSLALISHSATLSSVVYVNNTANAITSVSLTGSLSTATQTNPYVDNLAVATPAFLNSADAKYIVEQTANCDTTSAFQIYGLNLHFTRTFP